jgi:hypothetical protein
MRRETATRLNFARQGAIVAGNARQNLTGLRKHVQEFDIAGFCRSR